MIDRRRRDQEIAGAQSFESNTTDEGKESKKRNSEEGEENASLSRNVDSSLYLQFFFYFSFFFLNSFFLFFFSLLGNETICSFARMILILWFFILVSTTIEKSVEIRLYSPYMCDYIILS